MLVKSSRPERHCHSFTWTSEKTLCTYVVVCKAYIEALMAITSGWLIPPCVESRVVSAPSFLLSELWLTSQTFVNTRQSPALVTWVCHFNKCRKKSDMMKKLLKMMYKKITLLISPVLNVFSLPAKIKWPMTAYRSYRFFNQNIGNAVKIWNRNIFIIHNIQNKCAS